MVKMVNLSHMFFFHIKKVEGTCLDGQIGFEEAERLAHQVSR